MGTILIVITWLLDEGVPSGSWPDQAQINETVHRTLALAGFPAPEHAQISIRIVDDATMRALNRQWRQSDAVTDVLAFPMQPGPEYDPDAYLGDIALAHPFVAQEAERLGLPASAHLRHLIVHATLHLIGHDHVEAEERRRMQALERNIMLSLGLHDPYPAWQAQAPS